MKREVFNQDVQYWLDVVNGKNNGSYNSAIQAMFLASFSKLKHDLKIFEKEAKVLSCDSIAFNDHKIGYLKLCKIPVLDDFNLLQIINEYNDDADKSKLLRTMKKHFIERYLDFLNVRRA